MSVKARLRALADFIATYEAEHGEITEEEVRRAAKAAIPVRGTGAPVRAERSR